MMNIFFLRNFRLAAKSDGKRTHKENLQSFRFFLENCKLYLILIVCVKLVNFSVRNENWVIHLIAIY